MSFSDPFQKYNIVLKMIELFSEYRYNVRKISLQAIKENWTEDKLNNEIENISKDIDQFLDFYETYEKSRQFMLNFLNKR